MTDSVTYRDAVVPGSDGQPERVSYGADYVFTHRAVSAEAAAPLMPTLAAIIGQDPRDDTTYYDVYLDGWAYTGNAAALIARLAESRATAS